MSPAHAAIPQLRSKPESDRTALIKALLNEQFTGVPPLHQAILNKDFEMAKALLASGAWVKTEIQPPLSLDTQHAVTLFALGTPEKMSETHGAGVKDLKINAIVNLAIKTMLAAPDMNTQYVGANAITLALLSKAPDDFIEKLLVIAKDQYPAILDHADAQGRTPMSVAIKLGDGNRISWLLKNGARENSETRLKAALGLILKARQMELADLFLERKWLSSEAISEVMRHDLERTLTHTSHTFSAALVAYGSRLLPDDRLELLMFAAKTPGMANKLPMLYGQVDASLTPEEAENLREAAAASRDCDNYRWVRERDQYLAAALGSPLLKQSRLLLQREMVRAIQAVDEPFLQQLLTLGIDIHCDAHPTLGTKLRDAVAGLSSPEILFRVSSGLSVAGRPFTYFQQASNAAPDLDFEHPLAKMMLTEFEMYRTTKNEDEFMNLLLKQKNLLVSRDLAGYLLNFAVYKNYHICVNFLLREGVRPNNSAIDGYPGAEQWQPIPLAYRNGNEEIFDMLTAANGVFPPVPWALDSESDDD